MLYWELGKMITEKQTAWGSKFLERLSQDLHTEFPNMEGFSVTNLKYFRLFYQYVNFRPQAEDPLLLHYFKQIPWGHTKLIINKIKNTDEALFYIHKTIENGWSRNVLSLQINAHLFHCRICIERY